MMFQERTRPERASAGATPSWILSGVIAGVLAVASAPGRAAEAQQQTQAQRQYDVPAGTLDGALKAFASQAGIMLSADAALTAGKSSPGLNGSYTIPQGFVVLLSGSGLTAAEQSAGSYSVNALPARSAVSATSDRVADARTMNKIRVQGALDATTEGTQSYTADAVTIGKIAQSLRETPQSVSVITRQRMDDQNLTTLTQALSLSTGTITHGDPRVDLTSVYSRGFPVQQIQRDGVPMEKDFTFASADLAIYDRVEVLRGAAGLLNGAGQPGGTINLVRKRALADTRFSVTASGGSWNRYRVEADGTGALNASGSLRGRLVAVYQDEESFQDIANNERQIVHGRVEYDLAPDTTVSVGGTWENRDVVMDYYGLSRYSNGADLHLPRSTFLSTPWSKWEFDKPELFAEIEHQWNDAWKSKLVANRVRENSQDLRGWGVYGPVNPATQAGAMAFADGRVDRKGLQDALDATLSGTFELFGRVHEVLLGANFLETSTDIRISPYTGRTDQPWEEEPVDIFNFDPYAYPAPRGLLAPYVGVRVKTRQSGYYTALKFSATDELTLSAGARVSNYTTTNRSLLTGATTIDNDVDSEVTPYAAVIYDLTDTYSLYASYTDIFQVQNNYNDRGDLLPPIVGANYEAGVKAEWWDGLLNGSLALFRIEQTNRAQSDPRYPGTCLGSPTGACSIAEGEVRSEGAEIELSGQLLTDLELVAGYTYNTTEYIRDRTASGDPSANQGQPFNTITPEHLFRLWGNYKLPLAGKQFSVGTGLSAQSSMYFQNGGVRVGQGGYALWNARVGYTPNDRLTFSLNGNNLLDKVYYAGINFPGANYYGEPRNFMLTVRTTF